MTERDEREQLARALRQGRVLGPGGVPILRPASKPQEPQPRDVEFGVGQREDRVTLAFQQPVQFAVWMTVEQARAFADSLDLKANAAEQWAKEQSKSEGD